MANLIEIDPRINPTTKMGRRLAEGLASASTAGDLAALALLVDRLRDQRQRWKAGRHVCYDGDESYLMWRIWEYADFSGGLDPATPIDDGFLAAFAAFEEARGEEAERPIADHRREQALGC